MAWEEKAKANVISERTAIVMEEGKMRLENLKERGKDRVRDGSQMPATGCLVLKEKSV